MTSPWIDKPGVYELDVSDYHRDPVVGGSLSSTGARRLLTPSCPAKFRAWVDGDDQEQTEALNFGRAAHARVLGAGDPVQVMELPDGRTKEGKAAAAEKAKLIAAGYSVVSPEQDDVITAMTDALRAHPVASALLAPDTGTPEQTLVWQDPTTGVWCRALIDFMPHFASGQRLIVPDYKTTKSADPGQIERSIWDYGYHCQAEWYLDGVRTLGLAGRLDPAFVLIFQEKTAPYVVTVVQLDLDAQRWGQAQCATARRIYQRCTETGVWPAYSDDVVPVALPRYAINQLEERALEGALDVPEGGILL